MVSLNYDEPSRLRSTWEILSMSLRTRVSGRGNPVSRARPGILDCFAALAMTKGRRPFLGGVAAPPGGRPDVGLHRDRVGLGETVGLEGGVGELLHRG